MSEQPTRPDATAFASGDELDFRRSNLVRPARHARLEERGREIDQEYRHDIAVTSDNIAAVRRRTLDENWNLQDAA